MVSLLAMLLSLSLTMLLIEFMIRVNGPEDGVTLSGFSWDGPSNLGAMMMIVTTMMMVMVMKMMVINMMLLMALPW